MRDFGVPLISGAVIFGAVCGAILMGIVSLCFVTIVLDAECVHIRSAIDLGFAEYVFDPITGKPSFEWFDITAQDVE